jgi:sRNA-binding regulator protein Hfq
MDEMFQCKMYWQDNYNKQRDQSYSYRYITNGGCLVGEVYITNGGCLEGEVTNGECLEGEVYITNGGCLEGEVYITNGGCLEGELYISNGGCLEGEVEYYTLQLTFNFTSLCNALSFFF